MPPYRRQKKKKIPDFCSSCKSKFPTFARIVNQNSRLLLELKLKNCRFLKITTQKLTNFTKTVILYK